MTPMVQTGTVLNASFTHLKTSWIALTLFPRPEFNQSCHKCGPPQARRSVRMFSIISSYTKLAAV